MLRASILLQAKKPIGSAAKVGINRQSPKCAVVWWTIALTTTNAMVQTAFETGEDERYVGLEIIEITAQKRPEDAQDVPIAVTAFQPALWKTETSVPSRGWVTLRPTPPRSAAFTF
mgnify:CR=1 FL=1